MTAPELPLDAAALDRIESGEVGVGPSRGEKIIAQARAALTLRDKLAALAAELKDCEKMHGVQLARVEILLPELAECRAKLAQVVERCGYAELAVTQRTLERDNALAKLAQAEKERDEALDDAEAAVDAHANCACYERGAVVRIKHLEDALMESSSKRAASQARERELRGKLFDAERDFDVTAGQTTDTLAREACLHYRDKCATALARPVDDSALREMLTEAWRLGRRHGTHSMGAEGDAPPPMEQAISSLLGEKGDQS